MINDSNDNTYHNNNSVRIFLFTAYLIDLHRLEFEAKLFRKDTVKSQKNRSLEYRPLY